MQKTRAGSIAAITPEPTGMWTAIVFNRLCAPTLRPLVQVQNAATVPTASVQIAGERVPITEE